MGEVLAATETTPLPAIWTGVDLSWPKAFLRLPQLQEIRTGSGEVVYRYPGGAVTINEWVPVEMHALALEAVKNLLLRDPFYTINLVSRTDEGESTYTLAITESLETESAEIEIGQVSPLPESALLAKEVRDLSSLTAEQLGGIFPVERESYQRWVSGKTKPSSDNFRRLLVLRHFLSELTNRVQSPKSWLLTPLSESTNSAAPYEMLKTGNLSELWDAIADLPSKAMRYTRETADGSTLTVIEGSLRGRDMPTIAEELDDYDEWLSEDE